MKSALRLLLAVAALSFSAKNAQSQCETKDILISNFVPFGTQTPGSCTATFDISFSMKFNPGEKYINFHAWTQAQYPNYFQCTGINGSTTLGGSINAPVASDLANAFINVSIYNSPTPPVVLTSYPPDPSVPLNSVQSITRTALSDGFDQFVLHGVTATFPTTCGTPFVMLLDFWGSQSAHSQQAHCVNCNLVYPIGFLSATGLANCATLHYSATITNQTPTATTGTYQVYADVNGDGVFSTSADALITNTTSFSVAGSGNTAIGGSIPPAYINKDLLLITTITSGAATGGMNVFLIPSTQCAPLPVNLMTFNATRTSRTNVFLKWETASETNNSGFAVLRNMNGTWVNVGFVPSQAANGNSGMPLSYTFTDDNTYTGITQYRIRQVDLDGNVRYSNIRSVRGYGQKGKTIVYPNPSNGDMNVVFEDSKGTRDVTLLDMSGRTVMQWKAVTGNTLQINNLGDGMYSLRIVVRETGDLQTEKIIVNKSRQQ
jgi:hypothetical protein